MRAILAWTLAATLLAPLWGHHAPRWARRYAREIAQASQEVWKTDSLACQRYWGWTRPPGYRAVLASLDTLYHLRPRFTVGASDTIP